MRRIVLTVFLVELVILLVTGVLLFEFYRPSAAGAWGRVYGIGSGVTFSDHVRLVHRWVARLAVPTVGVLFVVAVLEAAQATRTLRRPAGVAIAAGLGIATLAASFTGWLLPWDQLGLWAVTVGTDMRGYHPIFSDQVRFIFLGGAQISVHTLRRWLVIHMVALPIAIGGLTAGMWGRSRRRPDPPAGDPVADPGEVAEIVN